MGRKYRHSIRKRYQSCAISNIVKKYSAGITYINIADYQFEIKQEVVEALQNNAQHNGNEMCGVLTGVQVGNNCYRICKVSPPCVKRNTRYGCERDAVTANRFIEEDYKNSEHTRFYIGEWHTHPENIPTPSTIDYRSIKENFQTASLVVPFLIMIIVGIQSSYICVYNGKDFVEVQPKIV